MQAWCNEVSVLGSLGDGVSIILERGYAGGVMNHHTCSSMLFDTIEWWNERSGILILWK